MSNEKILESAIWKAIDDGWNSFNGMSLVRYFSSSGGLPTDDLIEMILDFCNYGIGSSCYELIYNHDFARAFWGNKEMKGRCCKQGITMPAWKWHLQEQVIADDPVGYLAVFGDVNRMRGKR